MKAGLLYINDVVVECIPAESRAHGINSVGLCQVGVVKGFGEQCYGRINNCGHKPGVYEQHELVIVDFGNDGEPNLVEINHKHIKLVDEEDARGREAITIGTEFGNRWLRELPETAFWEGDIVMHTDLAFNDGSVGPLTIEEIQWHYLTHKRADGTNFPTYTVSLGVGGGRTYLREEELVLVRRGKVWQYFHNEPITFDNLEEEANFYSSLGHTSEVKNPKTANFKWTLEEALQAIRDGIVHAFSIFRFMGIKHLSCSKFTDEKLGQRVAEEFLKNFALGAVGDVALTGDKEKDDAAIAIDKKEREEHEAKYNEFVTKLKKKE